MNHRHSFAILALALLAPLAACRGPQVLHRGSRDLSQAREAAALSLAVLGEVVPDFELTSITGTRVRRSDYLGRVLVIEWFNPQCPFTKHAHTLGTLRDYPTSAREQGVVWLAINSASEEKMGGGLELNSAAREAWSLRFPILLDPTGEVGRRFDATMTPQVFLINAQGVLVYVGPVDNMPFGKVRGGGEGLNYLAAAVDDVLANKAVRTPMRQPYGCRIKYAQPTMGR